MNSGLFFSLAPATLRKAVWTLIGLSCLTGCVGPGISGLQYQGPSTDERVKNEILIHQSFDATWDALIGQLAKSFFVINNVEKASRIINISFATDKPTEYVDCGVDERIFSYRSQKANYTYPISGSNVYKFAGSWGPNHNLPYIASVIRKTSLEGRINVYVAPKDNETLVTVNTRYLLTIRTGGQAEFANSFGTVIDRQNVTAEPVTVSFNTGQTGIGDEPIHGPGQFKCRSNGSLEAEILKMPKRIQQF